MFKALSIASIKLYQKLAPQSIRDGCRYEPTCSNYAILAIQKYGVIKGWTMTVDRLKRCKFPDGGEDYP